MTAFVGSCLRVLGINATSPLNVLPATTANAFAPVATSAASAHPLTIAEVSKSFGRTQVLKEVSLNIAPGEFVTLLGPSGCGKTTLLRIIAGLETADTGAVRLGHTNLLELPANRRPVNTVFQSYALFPHLTVAGNVAFGLRARGVAESEIKAKVQDAMELLQLGEFAGRYTEQLSGGQKQRVALARALVNEPEVLLLDEPMSALDAKLRAEVQVELRRLQRRLGKTFLLVTHDQDEAMTVSDRILVMQQGRIAQAGKPHEVYEYPSSRFVAEFLGAANLINAQRVNGSGVDTTFGRLRLKTTPAWNKGTLAIRPERIRIHQQVPANGPKAKLPPNTFPAQVREVIFCGDHHELFIWAGDTLRVRVPSYVHITAGESIHLELPIEYLEPLVD